MQSILPIINCRNQRTGITGKFIGKLINNLACVFIKSNQGATVALKLGKIIFVTALGTATDRDQKKIPLDSRSATNAKEVLDHAKISNRIDFP